MTKFVILTTQRSGSIWLVDLLDSHSQIMCAGELFKRTAMAHFTRHSELSFSKYWQTRVFHRFRGPTPKTYRRYLSWFVDQSCEHAASGFKLMISHLVKHKNLVSALERASVSVVRLRRENLVEQLVSREFARLTGVRRRTKRDSPTLRVHIDPQTVIDRLTQQLNEREQLQNLLKGCPSLDICYEDLCSQPNETLLNLQNFLNVEPQSLSSTATKIVYGSLHEVVANYDQLKQLLERTKFEKYIAGRA